MIPTTRARVATPQLSLEFLYNRWVEELHASGRVLFSGA